MASLAAPTPTLPLPTPPAATADDDAIVERSELARCVSSSGACCWRWLSEGAANIVFTASEATHEREHAAVAEVSSPLVGATASSIGGCVIKVSKRLMERAARGASTEVLARRLQFAQRYIGAVMRPLFVGTEDDDTSGDNSQARECFDAGRLVWVRSRVLSTLLSRDRALRPAARVSAFGSFSTRDADDHQLLPVLLFEDYTSPLHLHLRGASIPRSPPSAPPTVCFEIKPKWGYLPRRDTAGIRPHNRVKFDTCRYCMHQHLKLKKGDISSLSGFCPLDLFSCTPIRVRRALDNLLRTPQNNFRIFVRVGGSKVDPGAGGTVQMVDLTDATQVERLVLLLFPQIPLADSSAFSHADLLHAFLGSFLCSSAFRPLFARLAQLQQALDPSDIEGLYPRIANLLQVCPEALSEEQLWKGVESSETSPDAPLEWISSLLAEFRVRSPVTPSSDVAAEAALSLSPSSSPPPPKVFEFPRTVVDEPDAFPVCAHYARTQSQPQSLATAEPVVTDADASPPSAIVAPSCLSAATCPHWHDSVGGCCCLAVREVRNFLLATTLKDVSFMCTLQTAPPVSASDGLSVAPSDARAGTPPYTRVHYSVRLVDLECKAVAKLPEYFRMDQEIVANYSSQH